MPKVSVIVPIYKVEPYIERCIRSVMAQSHTDIECILVDDCTPDNSMAVCERLLAGYSGPITFLTLHHNHNRGLSAARNTGTDAATGEYVFYLDSDDEITPDCISLMVAETECHPDVDMVSAAVKSIPYKPYYDIPFYSEHHYIANNRDIRALFFNIEHQIHITAWNKLVKRSFLTTNNLRFVDGILSEDEVWTFALVLRCNTLSVIPDRTYIHYETEGSIMTSFNYHSRCNTIATVLENIVPRIEPPLALLQVYRCLQHLFNSYRGINRAHYMNTSRRLAWLLVVNGKPLLALQTFIYFRFSSSLHLYRYEDMFSAHITGLYRHKSAKALSNLPS